MASKNEILLHQTRYRCGWTGLLSLVSQIGFGILCSFFYLEQSAMQLVTYVSNRFFHSQKFAVSLLKCFNWHFSISLFLQYPLTITAVCYVEAVSWNPPWVALSIGAARLTKVLSKYRFWMYSQCTIDTTQCSLHIKVKIQCEHSVAFYKMTELLLSVQNCKFLEK